MTTTRFLRVLVPAVLGAAVAGCTSSPGVTIGPVASGPPPSDPAASSPPPASAASVPTRVAASPSTPRSSAPGPSTAPVVTPVDLSPAAVPGCTSCRVVGVHRDLRAGMSVALLVGRKSTYSQRAVVVAYRSTTGAVLGQATVPTGDWFDTPDVPHPLLPCDNLAHCFVIGTVGAHSGTTSVFALTRSGAVDVIADLGADQPSFTVPDLDGDGVREIAAVQDDCEPSCASGRLFWMVRRWSPASGRYVLVGCAPHRQESRPPAHLDPAACPA